MMTYISENLWLFWAIVVVVSSIFELTTGGLFVLCFAFGALVTVPVSFFYVSLVFQIFVFILASAIAIFILRPIAMKYWHRSDAEKIVSNADAILGREGVVSQDIPADGYGRVALDGDDWKALSTDGIAIPKGTKVRITARESLIVTVSPVHKNEA